jgi:hypothetical protein
MTALLETTGLGRRYGRQVITFQPASRYWPLQWHEMGIYLGLSVILTGVCAWWIRRRAVGSQWVNRQYRDRG